MRPIVSPVPSAAAMIVVASISPTTIRTLRPRPPADVAHAEPEEHDVAQRERGEDRDAQPDEHRERHGQRVDRKPEHGPHGGYLTRLGRLVDVAATS